MEVPAGLSLLCKVAFRSEQDGLLFLCSTDVSGPSASGRNTRPRMHSFQVRPSNVADLRRVVAELLFEGIQRDVKLILRDIVAAIVAHLHEGPPHTPQAEQLIRLRLHDGECGGRLPGCACLASSALRSPHDDHAATQVGNVCCARMGCGVWKNSAVFLLSAPGGLFPQREKEEDKERKRRVFARLGQCHPAAQLGVRGPGRGGREGQLSWHHLVRRMPTHRPLLPSVRRIARMLDTARLGETQSRPCGMCVSVCVASVTQLNFFDIKVFGNIIASHCCT